MVELVKKQARILANGPGRIKERSGPIWACSSFFYVMTSDGGISGGFASGWGDPVFSAAPFPVFVEGGGNDAGPAYRNLKPFYEAATAMAVKAKSWLP